MFNGGYESLYHLGLDVVAIELIQLDPAAAALQIRFSAACWKCLDLSPFSH
jgi:hypothetical protein